MFNDRYSILIFLRVLLILGICLLFAFLFANGEYIFTQFILLSIIVLLSSELIRFTRKSSRELTKFLFAIRHGDMSVNFSEDRLAPYFRDLAGAFRDVIQAFKNVKIEKEAQFQLLQLIIDRISFGIIVFNSRNEIALMNKTAAKILGTGMAGDWNYIKKVNPVFAREAEGLGNEGKKLAEFEMNQTLVQLSLTSNFVKMLDEDCRIITFHDIQEEIEQKEIEAWFRIIRVLTHEIMNSMTPLSSLTETMLMLLDDNSGSQNPPYAMSETNIEDLRAAVRTIHSRSEGIIRFVEAYRQLTNIPMPEFEVIKVNEICHSVITLLNPELVKRGIRVQSRLAPESPVISADRNLIQQVLINLVTNSMYALEKTPDPEIIITAETIGSKTMISVRDNGKGIDPGTLDKIFLPFYSTRKGGSGIGLSFSKQVIHLHHGRILVKSQSGSGTEFILDLPVGKN